MTLNVNMPLAQVNLLLHWLLGDVRTNPHTAAIDLTLADSELLLHDRYTNRLAFQPASRTTIGRTRMVIALGQDRLTW